VRAIRQEKDTRKRQDLAEELMSQFTNEDWSYQELSDYAGLFAGLATWIRAASIQVGWRDSLFHVAVIFLWLVQSSLCVCVCACACMVSRCL